MILLLTILTHPKMWISNDIALDFFLGFFFCSLNIISVFVSYFCYSIRQLNATVYLIIHRLLIRVIGTWFLLSILSHTPHLLLFHVGWTRHCYTWLFFLSLLALQPNAVYDLLIHEVFLDHTQPDATQSVGLPWTNDQLVAGTSTWQHTTLTTDRHSCRRWDSNPQSQQASCRRPTP